MNALESSARIDDIELAQAMALAEHEFRSYESMARAAGAYATNQSLLLNQHSVNQRHPLSDQESYELFRSKRKASLNVQDARRIGGYFGSRANFAGVVAQAEYEGRPQPTAFQYHGEFEDGSVALDQADTRRKLEITRMVLGMQDVLESLGLSREIVQQNAQEQRLKLAAWRRENLRDGTNMPPSRIRATEALLVNHTSLDVAENKLLQKMLDVRDRKHDAVSAEMITQFDQLPALESMTLLDGFIRKQAVGPMVSEFIGKQVWHELLQSAPDALHPRMDALPTRLWRTAEVMKAADSLIGKFNGTVTDVSVMKLHVDEAWLQEYFADDTLPTIYADSVRYLRFIATLKPTGKPAEYSMLDCVTYIRDVQHQSTPSVVATTRRADRLSAEMLQASLHHESITVARVVESDQLRHEILAGLPTLGKRH